MVAILKTNSQINLLDFGLVQITGKDAAPFLQGQLTCDVTTVHANQNRLGAHCDAKGRVQATFLLFFDQEAYYFLLPKRVIPHLLSCLKKYAVFSAVRIVDVSHNWTVTGIVGPGIEPVLQKHSLLPDGHHTVTSSRGTISLMVTDPVPRFILLTPNDTQSPDFIHGIFCEMPMSYWHLLDILAGIPTIYPETMARFTPHQLNYPAIGGVSFDKGCYIGQEIIARTHYLGTSKNRLYRLTFQASTQVPAGTPLQTSEGSGQGTIIMASNEHNNHYQALACLQTQAISHTIHLDNPQGPVVQCLELL